MRLGASEVTLAFPILESAHSDRSEEAKGGWPRRGRERRRGGRGESDDCQDRRTSTHKRKIARVSSSPEMDHGE